MNLQISRNATQTISEAILISGTARGGTTIIGKIIHSMQGVEYVYEPPMLFMLFALINKVPIKEWKLFYETYLYEDFFLDALCGRSINCNKNDDSSIYKVKSAEEIDKRLSVSIRREEAEELCQNNHILSFKIPDVVPYLNKLLEIYPKTRIVVAHREPIGTLNSLFYKRWFSEENLNSNTNWPYKNFRGSHIPFWVKENDDELWIEMSELDRCAYYYIRMNEEAQKLPNKIEISYDHLITDPAAVVKCVSQKLGLQYGTKTTEIIKQIKATKIERDYSILEKIDPAFKRQIEHFDI